MIARGVVVATVHWRVMGAFNTCDTHKSSGRPTSRVPRERAVKLEPTQALSARVQLCALRRPPVIPRARGESIDRTRARRGGKPTSAWASSPCRKVRARRPFPGALSPARATAAAAPRRRAASLSRPDAIPPSPMSR